MILVTRHVNRNLTMLGNKLSSLVNLIHVVWVGMWFIPETHLFKSCFGIDVRVTTPIYQLIALPLMYNIGLKHTSPTPIFIINSNVCTPNNT